MYSIFEELNSINEVAQQVISDVELTGISRDAFPDVLEDALFSQAFDVDDEIDSPFTFTCNMPNHGVVEIDITRLVYAKNDFDLSTIRLYLDRLIRPEAAQEVALAFRDALNTEGYTVGGYLGSFTAMSTGRTVLMFEYKY
jgi:hypothetical protein